MYAPDVGKVFDVITDEVRRFVERQHVFFVATAPMSAEGHINCSPKGLDTLRVLGPSTVGYLDYTGSGAETIAHVRENGRIVIMLCAFDGAPNIVRFHGRGEVLGPDHPDFKRLLAYFRPELGVRSIIRVEVERISDSCGFGVPKLVFQEERKQLTLWAEKKGEYGVEVYKETRNAESIDGLPALRK